MSRAGLSLFAWQWQKAQPPAVRLAAPCKDDCTQVRPALAPHTDLPPVIVHTWKVLASLWMASVNDADRGITSSHNFWLPMADACCQTVEELLSFVTYSVAATELDPDQLVLGPETLTGVRQSHSACQRSFVSELRRQAERFLIPKSLRFPLG